LQTVLPSEFKRMMVLLVEGAPHVVEDFHTSGSAQSRHKIHVRMRQLKTGHVSERVFAENESVPVVHLETRRVNYSYTKGGMHVFLDGESFDEYDLADELVGERRWFLKENAEYKALLLEGRLLDIIVPPQVHLKIVNTAPPIRSGSDAAWKEAKLETGLQVMVPLFIAPGETVRVDTTTKKYAGRENP
jgi:elongation factor P